MQKLSGGSFIETHVRQDSPSTYMMYMMYIMHGCLYEYSNA